MKKYATIILLIVCVAVVSFPEIKSIRAQIDSAIFIRADGSVEGTDKILRNGNVYTFIGDINTSDTQFGITIDRENIVIDGAGHTLQGVFNRTAPWDASISRYGIRATTEDNITIKNLNIKNYGGAIHYFLSSYGSITNNNISDCGHGVFIYSSVNNTIKFNRLSNNNHHFDISCKTLSEYYHDVDTSNTMDGKPFYYWVNQNDRIVPLDAGSVFLINCTNIIIQNLDLSSSGQNILLDSTTNSTIQNNTLVSNGNNIGMELLNCHNNKISKNKIINREEGIRLWDSSNNFIEENEVADNSYGIRLRDANNNTIVHNTISENTQAINFWSRGTTNKICNNTITNGLNGLSVVGANVIDGNVLTDNSGTAISVTSNTRVTNNVVSNNSLGIKISSQNNVLRNNTMNENGFNLFFPEFHSNYWRLDNVQVIVNDVDESNIADGKPVCYWVNKKDKIVPINSGDVILVNCNNITVQNMNLKSNKQGIILVNTTQSTVFRNVLSENSIGLGVFHSHNNTISENIIKNNSVGIRIGDSKYNTIAFNNVTNNTWGIDFKGSQTNNTIYCNNFVENGVLGKTLQVSIDKMHGAGLGNFWDNGTVGNYWSDYKTIHPDATQINGTTVGNIPFYINENNQDNYPLIEVTNIPEFSAWITIPLLLAAAFIVLTAKKKLFKSTKHQTC